jgi:hypothetical protein
VLIALGAVLILVPRGRWLAGSALAVLVVFAGLTVIVLVVRRRRTVRASARFLGRNGPGAAEGEHVPSARMETAYRLALRGVPAVWIAQHCELPLALAELVVADARHAGGEPPREPGL